MKRLIVFFVLTLFLCSTTELGHFLKLPLIVTHYYSHKELNKALTFSEFWAIHYVGENASIPHDDQDMKLPFKSHDTCTVQLNAMFLPPTSYVLVHKKFSQIAHKQQRHLNDRSITSSYLASIWQPPKSC